MNFPVFNPGSALFNPGSALPANALLLGSTVVLAQDAAPVSVAMSEAQPAVERFELTGSLMDRRAARLSPRLPGLVESVEIDAGDEVAAGSVLVQLDDRLAEL